MSTHHRVYDLIEDIVTYEPDGEVDTAAVHLQVTANTTRSAMTIEPKLMSDEELKDIERGWDLLHRSDAHRLLAHVSALTIERDQYRRDFAAMSDRCAELATALSEMERQRDAALQLFREALRQWDQHRDAMTALLEVVR